MMRDSIWRSQRWGLQQEEHTSDAYSRPAKRKLFDSQNATHLKGQSSDQVARQPRSPAAAIEGED